MVGIWIAGSIMVAVEEVDDGVSSSATAQSTKGGVIDITTVDAVAMDRTTKSLLFFVVCR